jgi:hypothetical protein
LLTKFAARFPKIRLYIPLGSPNTNVENILWKGFQDYSTIFRYLQVSRIDMTASSPQPLTTVFTPPASCLTDTNYYSYTASQSNALFNIGNNVGCGGYQCYAGYPSDSNCYPTGWALSQAFSPGVCPESYTIACSSLITSGTAIETIATCCPE